jgi:hypothetical protein
MPQTSVILVWKADYPILTPRQKPGGVTVTTTLAATAVPNKAPFIAGTIQAAEGLDDSTKVQVAAESPPSAEQPQQAQEPQAQASHKNSPPAFTL